MKAYFSGKDSQLFCLEYGETESRKVAILLQPFPWEMQRLSWTYKQLSMTLSANKMRVINFHYRSTGDSSGRSQDFSIESAREDIKTIIAEQNRNSEIILIGFRLGANLLEDIEDPRIICKICVDPILDALEYLQMLQKMHLAYLEEVAFEPPYQNTKNKNAQLLGFHFSEFMADQILKLQFKRDQNCITIMTFDKGEYPEHFLLAEEKAALWSSWQKLNFTHFSHKTIELLNEQIVEAV